MPKIECETFDVPGYAINNFRQYDAFKGLKYLEASAAHDKENNEVTIFVVNRDWNDDIETELDVRGFDGYKLVEHIEMSTEDLKARNSYENPDAIKPVVNKDTKFDNGKVAATFKKLSWNVIRLSK